MFLVSKLVGTSGVLLFYAAAAAAASPAAPADCAAQQSVVPVSKTPAIPDAPREGATLPDAQGKAREPAVLLPACKAAPQVKRKKRLSDYPMA
jgi:hypothetical protein